MAQSLLSVWHDEPVEFDPSVPPTEDMRRMFDQVRVFNADLEARSAAPRRARSQSRSACSTASDRSAAFSDGW